MSIRPLAKLFALLVAVLSAAPATAEVTSATPNGFSIRVVTPIRAERAEVYAAAVGEVGSWWHDDHTVSGFAANLYLDTQVPGCFCESLGEGSAIVHMMVTYVSTNIVVRLTGGLGPLGLMGVNGNMTWEFDDAESGTVDAQLRRGRVQPGRARCDRPRRRRRPRECDGPPAKFRRNRQPGAGRITA